MKRFLWGVLAVAACNQANPAGGDAGTDGGGAASCHACDETGGSWCEASHTCLDRHATDCEYGLIDRDSYCDDPTLFVKSQLPVDCRRPASADDPHCKSDGAPKSVGRGFNDNYYAYGGGFIDAAHNRLVVAFACDFCSAKDTGIMGIDLTTGDRTLLSGAVNDPLTGPASVGTGDILTSVDDVEVAPNGKWWVLDAKNGSAMVHEVDPATGNRTIVYDQPQFELATSMCRVNGLPIQVGVGNVSESFTSGLSNMIIHPDGKVYLRGERVFNPDQSELDLEAIVELDHDTCRIVTSYSRKNAAYNHGGGPSINDTYGWLTEKDGKLIANVSYYFVHSIDIATGNRTMLSSSETDALLGMGGNLGGAYNTIGKDGSILTTGNYLSHVYGGIVAVDPTTGDRTTIVPAAGPQRNGDEGLPIAHPALDGVYLIPNLGMVTLFEPATRNSMFMSR